MSNESGRMLQEVVVADFEVLSQYLPEVTKDVHKNLQSE
jgi:hypothetical protein